MQKAQDLHMKHHYAIGEDQDSVANSSDVLPEITVNEVTSREDRGWYRNKRDFREHSQNSREMSPQRREHSKKVTFNQPPGTRTTAILLKICMSRTIIQGSRKATSRVSSQV